MACPVTPKNGTPASEFVNEKAATHAEILSHQGLNRRRKGSMAAASPLLGGQRSKAQNSMAFDFPIRTP
jgi:hypothetical protein